MPGSIVGVRIPPSALDKTMVCLGQLSLEGEPILIAGGFPLRQLSRQILDSVALHDVSSMARTRISLACHPVYEQSG
jgi:hypothetical protein